MGPLEGADYAGGGEGRCAPSDFSAGGTEGAGKSGAEGWVAACFERCRGGGGRGGERQRRGWEAERTGGRSRVGSSAGLLLLLVLVML